MPTCLLPLSLFNRVEVAESCTRPGETDDEDDDIDEADEEDEADEGDGVPGWLARPGVLNWLCIDRGASGCPLSGRP